MPEHLYKSSDVPDFASYPASPEAASQATSLHPSGGEPSFEERSLDQYHLQGTQLPSGTAGLNERAEQIGTAVAGIANQVRNIADHLRSRASDLTSMVKSKVDDATAKVSDATDAAKNSALDAAQYRFDQARTGARKVVREYPIHVIAGVGIAAFLVGAAIRMRRGSNE